MARKKRAAENEGDGMNKKQRRKQYSGSSRPISTMDINYGQRAVFGDFECLTTVPTGDSDLDCEDDSEALAYLKSVRVQASAVPHILVASKAGPQLPPQLVQQPVDILDDQQEDRNEQSIDRTIYRDGRGDFRGYYEDGAYIAYPPGYFDEENEEEEEEEDKDEEQEEVNYDDENKNHKNGEEDEEEGPELEYSDESSFESSEGRPHNSNSDEIRDAYFTSLTTQYLALREVLQMDPPGHLLLSLPKSNPTEVTGFGRYPDTFVKWSGRLRGTDPLPAQIAGMHKEDIFRLLRIILGGKFLRKNQELRERTSRWIWALLARLPERGELDYQEIGWIRELGKRAVLLMVSLAEMEVLKEHYEVGDSSVESQGEVEVDEGIDDSSLEECCDDEYIDTDSNDPEAHQRSPDPSPGDMVSGSIASDVKDGDATDANTNGDTKHTIPENGNGTKVKANGTKVTAPVEKAEELSDVEMQIDSDSEEDGEVSDTPQQQAESTADIERAKARLLKQLGATAEDADKNTEAETETAADPPAMSLEEEAFAALEAEEQEKKREETYRAKVNERATLNMILTVAGEFYGQRDLLEFRDPFGGLQIE